MLQRFTVAKAHFASIAELTITVLSMYSGKSLLVHLSLGEIW